MKKNKNILQKQSIRNDEDTQNRKAEPSIANVPSIKEVGGRKGPEPTRYGDWEKNGRCIDF